MKSIAESISNYSARTLRTSLMSSKTITRESSLAKGSNPPTYHLFGRHVRVEDGDEIKLRSTGNPSRKNTSLAMENCQITGPCASSPCSCLHLPSSRPFSWNALLPTVPPFLKTTKSRRATHSGRVSRRTTACPARLRPYSPYS